MTAGLSTTNTSTRGVVLPRVAPEAKVRDLTRRVTRSATLDGAAVLTDQGFSDGDRTLTIRASVEQSMAEAVEYLLRNYQTVVVSVDTGCFLAALSALTYTDGDLQVTVLVQSRLSEA